MLMAEDGPNLYSMVGGCEFEDFGEDMSFDADVLLQILETDSDPLPEGKQMENVFLSFYCLLCLSHESQVVERNAEVLPSKNVSPGKQACNALGNKTSVQQNGSQVLESAPPTHNDLSCSVTSNSLYNVEGLDSITGSSRHLFDSTGNSMMTRVTDNVGVPGRIHSPIHATSASLRDWISQFPVDETFYPEKIRVSEFEIPTRSTASSFANADPMYDSYQDDDLNVTFQKREPESQTHARDLLKGSVIKRKDNNLGSYGSLEENRLETNGLSENNSHQSFEVSLIDGLSSQNATSVESTICQSSDVVSDFVDCQTTMPLKYFMSTNDMSNPPVAQYFLPELDNYQYFHGKGEIVTEVKDESQEFSSDSPCSSSIMNLYPQSETTANSVTKAGLIDGTSDIRGWNYGCKDSDYMLSTSDSYAFQADNCHIDDKATENLLMQTLPSKDLAGHMNIELFGEMFQPSMMTWNAAGVNESFHSRSPYNSGGAFLEDSNLLWSGNVKLGEEHISSKLKRHSQSIVQETASVFSIGHQLNLKLSENYLSHAEPSTWNEQHMDFSEVNEDGVRHQKLSFNSEATHSEDNSYVENDPDISIIEDIGDPLPFNRSIVVGKSVVSQCSTISDSHSYMGAGSMRHKSQDEQLVLRVALQDLSQPKSEATPPDGLMAVPLLRHQKIALSWMVQKETASLHCMGGILADDQGLGKTVSTIALILKERPLFHGARKDCKQRELETLNLDEDDDDMLSENDRTKRVGYSPSGNTTTTKRVLEQAKERPGAGTLVVCPTSVLRQWAEELQSKVTNEAKLSVLVYHGSNRTKDHYQLAKYDVVLTTYSIVSMEVPKQSMVNEDEDEKGKAEDHLSPSLGFSSSKKRKYPSSSDKSCSKSKKGVDTAEAVAGPLAKVLWFRVVLDEAQSIKNHRTQVARACWGLRAKRRWCLSGTPIQNAIDDLYSYFRFLKYDPYAAYKSFYSAIKMPITRNPSKGYKKLQAVLKTIMLRRTKATLLDGQPIISLPPKVIELKKVDFSKEERDFYTRLEADSRAQFEEYAAAGTVKQNYVNILLMLLRLRQACDHPLLVRPYDTNSSWRSSVDMAKQLPRDKQLFLLDCLEASLAICGICMDPPEDAVVTNCGHVFCKQCICERLSGDDYQCSAKNCKVRLSMSSVFSKSALDSALSEQASHDFAPDCSHSDAVGAVESLAESQYYESSKIRAAIEVLQSLCKPCDYLSRHILPPKIFDETNACPEKFSGSHSPDIDERTCEHQNLALDNGSNEPIKVKSEKAIVFSQWTRMLDLLEAYLKSSSIQYRRLDGTMSVQARDKAVKDFNTLPEVSVMIMSLKAASLGLNMVAACHVLLLDLWWNPTTEDQAIDRAHRIGQTRPVKVLRLTVRDTVEDRILALQQKKREMVSSAFGEDGSGGKQTRLTVEDLKYLFMM